jgi:hypothetical protein
MPGLVPGIHVFLTANETWMAGPGHDVESASIPIPIGAGIARWGFVKWVGLR